jgi:hypothetical protein
MPPMNPKNFAITGNAAFDLTGTNSLSEELTDEEERRKRLLQSKAYTPGIFGDNTIGTAAMALFGQGGKKA